jgi:phage terminase large subunit GpA-like protein
MTSSSILQSALDVVRPPLDLAPSEFAAQYRMLKEGTTPNPGPWDRLMFPYLDPIMDAVREAIETGKNLVLMKSAQGGGSEAMENALHWLQVHYPGPMLYLISKDDLAKEFSRDRFAYANETIEPLARKHLGGKAAGETIQIKRYVDGKLVIAGGRSVLNLQSSPYRVVIIDEYDSMLDEIKNEGDPLKLAEMRTAAFAEAGAVLVIAFAHPTTKDRGAGKLYYAHSDQRRCHVICPGCQSWFPLTWDHVEAANDKDPTTYKLVAPCCGRQMSDGERFAAVRNSKQISTVSPEEGAKKKWIGVHFSQLCSKPLSYLAHEWASSADEPSVRRVVVNKVLGDVYDDAEWEVGLGEWERLLEERDVGTPPPETEFLTAGQDSGARELHWAVWAWARIQDQLCGFLVDAGVEPGPLSFDEDRRTLTFRDLEVFDEVLYRRTFGVKKFGVVMGMHDAGWQPGAVYEYCRSPRQSPAIGRAFPSKGLALDDRSRSPNFAWHQVLGARIGEVEVKDPNFKRADLNTYALKCDFFALAGAKRLFLPRRIHRSFLEHLSSERLVNDDGRRKWVARGANHWLDCSILAFAAALNVDQMIARKKTEETPQQAPSWKTGARGGKW